MPVYNFRCECGDYSVIRPMSEYTSDEPCPICGKAGERVFDTPTVHWGVGFERNRTTSLRPEGSRKLAKKMWNKRTD